MDSTLDRYRIDGETMPRTGDSRPSRYCYAHAITSGGHPEAIALRGIMAWAKMRIDDPH